MQLEQIVRPFARPDTLARRRLVASNTKVEVPDAIISWGSAGTLAGAHEIEQIDSGGGFTVITCDDRYVEDSRQERTIRIENPDDSSQYVNVARPTEITFTRVSENLFNTQNYNKTTTWKSTIESVTFSTTDINNKKCQSRFQLSSDV